MRLGDGRRAGTAGCAPASCKAGSAGCAPASCKAPFRARRPRLPATVRAAPGDGWWGEPGLSLGKFSVANTHFGSQEGKWQII